MSPRLVALGALAALGVGLTLAVVQWSGRRAPAAPGSPAAVDDTLDERVIAEALRSAPVDSAVLRNRWHEEVRGLEYDDLDPRRRELFLRFANAERCTCGCGFTLAGCLASDMTCDISRPRAQALLDSVRAGWVRTAAGLRERPSGG